MSKADYEARTEKMMTPIADRLSLKIYDVEFVKEGEEYYLRVYIDKENGVTIDDCEAASRALSDELDKEDFISEAYILEVSSPGLGRTLKKERHYLNSLGQEVEIKTYKPIDGLKEFTGILKDYKDGTVMIETDAGVMNFTADMIAKASLTIDF
jgi:ribosome maturation factor RimP